MTLIKIGHIAWNGGRVAEGDFVIAAGNDPQQADRVSLLSRGEIGDREGATVLIVVLPGRFNKDAESIRAAIVDLLGDAS